MMDVTTVIEETLLDENSAFYMLALDFQKCFDRVPQSLVLQLAERLGLNVRILRPLRAMYKKLRRRFKMPLGVGAEFEVTNGILQGCPLSVILINALLFVMLAKIETEVPDAFTLSFADDANLCSRLSEDAVQRALTFVEKFCSLTGMKLNARKTVMMGITRGSKAFRKNHPYESSVAYNTDTDADNVTLETVVSHKLLGVIASTSYDPETRSNPSRIASMNSLCATLADALLPFYVRCYIATSVITTTALFGCAFAYISRSQLHSLCTNVTTGVWGKAPAFKSRNQVAVMSILNKSHLMDPKVIVSYSSAKALVSACERSPKICERVNRILSLHGTEPSALGPVGLALLRSPPGTICWGTNVLTAFTRPPVLPLAQMQRGLRHHVLRDVFRELRWRGLAEDRPSYHGVALGVDTTATNKLRLTTNSRALAGAVACIIAGAFHRAGRWKSRAVGPIADTDGDAADVTDAEDDELQHEVDDRELCPHCMMEAAADGGYHLWFECPAFAGTRNLPEFAPVLALDRTHWPHCLTNWGVVPTGVDIKETHVLLLHTMMGAILMERQELGRLNTPTQRTRKEHAWRMPSSSGSYLPTFDFSSLPDTHSGWPFRPCLFNALTAWLAQLRWSEADSSSISIIELALDFEVTSGLLVQPAKSQEIVRDLTVVQRGKQMSLMLKALQRIAKALGLGDPLPATRTRSSKALRTLGAPTVSGGYSPRALISPATMSILESQLQCTISQHISNDWGSIVPVYHDPDTSATSPPLRAPREPTSSDSDSTRRPRKKRRPTRQRPRSIPTCKPASKRGRKNPHPPSSSSDDDDNAHSGHLPKRRTTLSIVHEKSGSRSGAFS